MKEVMIAATSSHVGKTTITLGLIQALINRGLRIQPYKVGPDYVDTAFHSQICQREAINLDEFMIEDDHVLRGLYYEGFQGADLAVTEGVMGLYDGLGSDHLFSSSAGMAMKLDIPVLLIIDGSGSSTSAAAMVKGFIDFEPGVNIIGVLVNHMSGPSHYQLIKKAIERYTDAPCLGYLTKEDKFHLPSRRQGLVLPEEQVALDEKIQALAHSIERTVDLDLLLKLIDRPSVRSDTCVKLSRRLLCDYYDHPASNVSLAYARDEAFTFYYHQNLSLFRKRGVNLIPFSPLHDRQVPQADGYYFGGGYASDYAQALAENQSMIQSIQAAHEADKPIIVEGESLIYFSEKFSDGVDHYPMLSIFQGTSMSLKKKKNFGYAAMLLNKNTPISKAGQVMKGHQFHYSDFKTDEEPIGRFYKERDGERVKEWMGAYVSRQCFASYLQFHLYQSPALINRWIQSLKVSRKEGSR